MTDLYDSDYFDRLPRESRRIENIIRELDLDKSDRVCEFGCGTGDVIFAISNLVDYCLGIDFSADAIKMADDARKERQKSCVEFACGDITTICTMEKYHRKFTKVLMMDVTEHIDDGVFSEFLRAAKKILKKQGVIYIHTPNKDSILEIMKDNNFILKQLPGHIAVRNARQYQHILNKEGIQVTSVKYLPHYNKLVGLIDRLFMNLPGLGRYFRSRLLIKSECKVEN